ncbi:MAG: succinate dehydrogenase [Waddliaceae bacterium]|nr:succinate dehydrogenase [Waddliaceae bacterium]
MTNVMQKELPKEFVWRRLHSLTGFFLVLFLFEHLLTNSQAALWIGDDGSGFIRAVNFIHSLPYLNVIEVCLLGIPIAVHMVWGVQYLRTAQPNSASSDGSKPSLGQYGRNRAYTWQRITSWILLLGIFLHVGQMRFMNYPSTVHIGNSKLYVAPLEMDEGLYTLSERLNVQLIDSEWIEDQVPKESLDNLDVFPKLLSFYTHLQDPFSSPKGSELDEEKAAKYVQAQHNRESQAFAETLRSYEIEEGQVLALVPEFGTITLLIVRETFKVPLFILLYSIFVVSAVFHACNGLWTFCMTWGIAGDTVSQKRISRAVIALMLLLMFLGLSAVWGTYWVNLRF